MKPLLADICTIDWKLVIAAAQVLTTILVACLVYYFTKKNMRNETTERVGRFKNEKKLEACMGFWGLQAYTTDVENLHSILYWQLNPATQQKNYYLHQANAKAFITNLNTLHYEKGYGLFLTPATKQLLYEYRSILFGFLLKEKSNSAEKIKIDNPDMVARMVAIHQQLITQLKQEMEL
jgi:hypothetical protein